MAIKYVKDIKQSGILNFFRKCIERCYYGRPDIGKHLQELKEKIGSLEKSIENSRDKEYEIKDRYSRETNRIKENYEKDLKKLQKESKEKEEKNILKIQELEKKLNGSEGDYSFIETLADQELENILYCLDISLSSAGINEKITSSNFAHYQPKDSVIFMKKCAKNPFVIKITSCGARPKQGSGTQTSEINGNSIDILYFKDSCAETIRIKTTTERKLANICIAEMLRRNYK